MVRIRTSTTQAIAAGSTVVADFNGIVEGPIGVNYAIATDQITVPADGLYIVGASLQFPAGLSGDKRMNVMRDRGGTAISIASDERRETSATVGSENYTIAHYVGRLVANDILWVTIFSVGATSVTNSFRSFFTITQMGH